MDLVDRRSSFSALKVAFSELDLYKLIDKNEQTNNFRKF